MGRTFYSRYTKGDKLAIEITSSDISYINRTSDLVKSSGKQISSIRIIEEGRNKTLEVLFDLSMKSESKDLFNEIMIRE